MKKAISNVDIGAIPNPVFIDGKPALKSFYCAIISIIMIIFLIIYSISKLSKLGSSINYEFHQIKNHPTVDIDGIQFNITITYSVNDEYIYLNCSNMYNYGLNVSITYESLNNSYLNVTSMFMQDNYDYEEERYYFSLPQNIPTQLQTISTTSYRKMRIWIKKCDTKKDFRCKDVKLQDSFIIVQVDSLLNSDYGNQTGISSYNDYWDDLIPLEYYFTYQYKKLYFGAYQLIRDSSILPRSLGKPDIYDDWFYLDSQKRDQTVNIIDYTDTYFIYEFNADEYSSYYSEVSVKLDYILPQIFTLFSLAALALKVISGHYRDWSLKLLTVHHIYGDKKRSKHAFSEDDQKKNILGINLKNYFKFLKSTFKKLRKAQQQDTESIKITKQKLQKVVKKMDYVQMSKKIYLLDKLVKKLCRLNKLQYGKLLQQIEMQPESDLSDEDQNTKKVSQSLLYSE